MADIDRRPSATTQTHANHEGMMELKQAKEEWMSRLEVNDTEFKDLFDSHDSFKERLSLNTFLNATYHTLKHAHSLPRIAAPPRGPTTPPPRPLITTASGDVVVRRRPHSIEPILPHRLKAIAEQTSPKALTMKNSTMGTPTFGSSTSSRSPHFLEHLDPATTQKVSKDLMVVTGKVDYRKLKEEQKTLNAKTVAADVQYRQMLDRFDQFNAEVDRRFNLMLHDSNTVFCTVPEDQQGKHLINVSDNTFRKLDAPHADQRADAL